MNMDSVLDLFCDFEDLQSEASLEEKFEASLSFLGIEKYAFGETGIIQTSNRLNIGTYPAEWLDRYFGNRYWRDDPIHIATRQAVRPFNWCSLSGIHSAAGKKVLEEARSFDVRDGYTVPIFHNNGYHCGVSYVGEGLEEGENTRSILHLGTVYFHGNLIRIRDAAAAIPNVTFLTPRENECLQWVAAGKSDWEIGEVLSISKKTAHTHVESAKRKFGVHTRVQAVVAALRNGSISY